MKRYHVMKQRDKEEDTESRCQSIMTLESSWFIGNSNMVKRQGIELFVLLVVLFASVTCDFLAGDEDDAAKFLNDINADYVEQASMQQNLHWNYETDITVKNIQAKVNHFVLFIRIIQSKNPNFELLSATKWLETINDSKSVSAYW